MANNVVGFLERLLHVHVPVVHMNDASVLDNLEAVLKTVDAAVVGPGPGHPSIREDGIIRIEGGGEKDSGAPSAATAQAPPLRELLEQQLDGGQQAAGLRDDVLAALTGRLARALMIPAREVDTLKSPANLGADSLVAVEVRNWLLREGGVAFPVFEILQAPGVVALAGAIVDAAKAKYTEGKK
ncbi:hypothetical protein PG985_009642 [Apiospora marii]|uniref:Carrier domain-containing protein n=1 Tax=Apiospora marii TaxID=335849 RepID=A0ABR1RFU7_9PEZI